MPARVHIVCDHTATAALLERCRATAGALWLGPTRRAVAEVRRRLGDEVYVAAVADFVAEIVCRGDPDTRPLSAAQRRLVLDDVVHDLHRRGELKLFGAVSDTRGFAEGLTNLLAELQRLGVTPARFARACGSGAKERECARLYGRYVEDLGRLRLLDPDGRTARAAVLLRDLPFDMRAVFLDGFSDFTAVQYDLLDALCERVEEVWVALPDEPGDDRDELFRVPRETVRRLRERYAALPTGHLAPGLPGGQPDPRQAGGYVPSGLAHLSRQLFRPLRNVEVADNADGVKLIEAPGLLGEARMVARHVKTLMLVGTAADDILVVLRDLDTYADLLHEVFAEYGLPHDVQGTAPLQRDGAVAALLRAVRLPDEDWPFAGVTALLRNTFFRPAWAETADDPEMPLKAEALLRLFGEPRGREAYLGAAKRWAEQVQPGLEDEQAEESRRRRTHELARHCAAFLPRFFAAWDNAPNTAPLAEHVAWLRRFADDLGLGRGREGEAPAEPGGRARPEPRPPDAALTRFWQEVGGWLARPGRPIDRKTFHRGLVSLAATAGLPRTERGPGRVRVLSAEVARNLDAGYVFLMGVGERSFPRLALPPTLLDESERQTFRQTGMPLALAENLLPGEMALFYQLVTKPRRGLVLSYPAVDERGQALLPSSFLLAVLDCFKNDTVPTERRRMLTEGLDSDEPLSLAELRVRLARSYSRERTASAGLSSARGTLAAIRPDMLTNLGDAAELVRRRFHEKRYTPYDGSFRDPAVIAEVGRHFGPERVFSPTALEDYVACPFRFYLRHVLGLEPLEDPKEEIEVTRRGQAVHRALARLHTGLKEKGVHRPDDAVRAEVLRAIAVAVEEDVSRAPSPASKELWRIEGRRLLRTAGRYGDQWDRFLAPWLEKGVRPTPHLFEVEFGLPGPDGTLTHGPLVIRADGVEVRVSGRIDRVDVAELPGGVGFWIIDYKTGRAGNYTGTDLAAYRRLQLTLYALAVEEVLLAGRDARPLGLAYWLVTDTGPKIALPGRNQLVWLDEGKPWREVREKLQAWVVKLVANIRRGNFPLAPRSEHCTATCPFGQVCRIAQARAVAKEGMLPLPGDAELGEPPA